MPAATPDTMQVLVIGATGMLGRPVVRQLVADRFLVRALARDPNRAKRLLPKVIEIVGGDVRDQRSLSAAMRGVDAVYLNLAAPMKRRAPAWDPELHGTRAAIEAANAASVRRIVRISALGVDRASNEWWAANHKRMADDAVMESNVPWTVFRPTWLMESLATLKLPGRFIMSLNIGEAPLRWIAGEDYARQVSAALTSPAAMNQVCVSQGPELLTIPQAVRRFARAWPGGLRVIPAPVRLMRLGRPLSGKVHYLTSLLDMTRDHFSALDQHVHGHDLPRATMTIEQYVQSIQRTGDMPRK